MDKQRQLHPEDDMNSIELTNVSHHSDHDQLLINNGSAMQFVIPAGRSYLEGFCT